MTDWGGLLKDSLFKPRSAAAVVLSWPLSTYALILIAALMSVLGAIFSSLSFQQADDGVRMILGTLLSQPILFAVMQFIGTLILAGLMTSVGRAFQGTGTFQKALALTVWFNAVSVVIQLVFSVTSVVVPPVALLVGLFMLVWFFWALSAFAAELHGFRNGWRVFGGLFVTLVVLSFTLNILFVMLGIVPPGVPN